MQSLSRSNDANNKFGICLDCEDPASGKDRLCSACRGFRSSKRNFQKRNAASYRWDASSDLLLKRSYDCDNRRELSRNLTRLAADLGYPKSALRRRAEQVGLTAWKHVRWTQEEIDFLADHAGLKTVGWITDKLKQRTGISRSYNSVKCKAEEIGLTLRLREGYSQKDLAELFGTTEFTVKKWFERGWLKLSTNGRAREELVAEFLIEHPAEWYFKRVNEAWVKGLLFDRFGFGYIRSRRRAEKR